MKIAFRLPWLLVVLFPASRFAEVLHHEATVRIMWQNVTL